MQSLQLQAKAVLRLNLRPLIVSSAASDSNSSTERIHEFSSVEKRAPELYTSQAGRSRCHAVEVGKHPPRPNALRTLRILLNGLPARRDDDTIRDSFLRGFLDRLSGKRATALYARVNKPIGDSNLRFAGALKRGPPADREARSGYICNWLISCLKVSQKV